MRKLRIVRVAKLKSYEILENVRNLYFYFQFGYSNDSLNSILNAFRSQKCTSKSEGLRFSKSSIGTYATYRGSPNRESY